MPTGYFLRLAGLFTQSPGNLGHGGHTCTVSETKLELHSGTNQPQRLRPEYDPEGPVGLAWLQRGWHWVQLALVFPCQTRAGARCMCVRECFKLAVGGVYQPPSLHPSFLFSFFFGTFFGNWFVRRSIGNTVGTHWHASINVGK